MGKMGRPKVDNPKSEQVTVRLDAEASKMLNENAEHYRESKAESLRRGIVEVNKGLKK